MGANSRKRRKRALAWAKQRAAEPANRLKLFEPGEKDTKDPVDLKEEERDYPKDYSDMPPEFRPDHYEPSKNGKAKNNNGKPAPPPVNTSADSRPNNDDKPSKSTALAVIPDKNLKGGFTDDPPSTPLSTILPPLKQYGSSFPDMTDADLSFSINRSLRVDFSNVEWRRPVFAPKAWAKLVFLRDIGHTEVAGFFIMDQDYSLYITDFVLCPQMASAGSFKFDLTGYAKMCGDFADRKIGRARTYWGFAHTHPSDDVRPSSVDNDTFNETWGDKPLSYMFILGKADTTLFRLRMRAADFIHSIDLPQAAIDWSKPVEITDADYRAWTEEYKRCVHTVASALPAAAVATTNIKNWDNKGNTDGGKLFNPRTGKFDADTAPACNWPSQVPYTRFGSYRTNKPSDMVQNYKVEVTGSTVDKPPIIVPQVAKPYSEPKVQSNDVSPDNDNKPWHLRLCAELDKERAAVGDEMFDNPHDAQYFSYCP